MCLASENGCYIKGMCGQFLQWQLPGDCALLWCRQVLLRKSQPTLCDGCRWVQQNRLFKMVE
eukprot:1161779-Pyramimonas_sp.AAC.1